MAAVFDKDEAQPNVDERMSDEACEQQHADTDSAQDRANSMSSIDWLSFWRASHG